MEIYRTGNEWAAQMLRDLLVTEGIAAEVRDSLGPYPQLNVFVVYLLNEADEPAATAILARFNEVRPSATPESQQRWRCPNCGEEVEAQFAECWKCETARSVPET